MKARILGLMVAAACVLAASSTADAAIEAWSSLRAGTLLATDTATGDTLTGTFDVTNPFDADFLISGLLHNSGATAQASGFPLVASLAGGLPDTNMNTFVAESGASGGPPAGVSARGEDNFTNYDYSGFEPSAAADTAGVGTIVDIPGFSVGVNVATVAEAELSSDIFTSQDGFANSTVQVGASFILTPFAPLTVTLAMLDVGLDLLADTSPTPPGSFASAGSSWTLTITNPDGTTGLLWAPDGIIGNVTGSLANVETLDDFALTRTVSAGPGDVAGAFTGVSGDFKVSTTLLAGVQYRFAVGHTSQAQVVSVGIPEPSACIVWGLLVVTAGAFYRRRRVK